MRYSVGPSSIMTGILTKRGNLDRKPRTQGEHDVTMKAEIRVMPPQGKEQPRLLANRRKLGEKPGSCPEKKPIPCTMISDF